MKATVQSESQGTRKGMPLPYTNAPAKLPDMGGATARVALASGGVTPDSTICVIRQQSLKRAGLSGPTSVTIQIDSTTSDVSFDRHCHFGKARSVVEVVPIPATEEAVADPSLAAVVQAFEVASMVAGTVAPIPAVTVIEVSSILVVVPMPVAIPGLVPMFVQGSIVPLRLLRQQRERHGPCDHCEYAAIYREQQVLSMQRE